MEKKNKSATVTVLFMILAMIISKLLGMFRGVLLAASYGTTESATAFSAASRIPLSFFDIVFASAILGCFIPVYNSFSGNDKKREQNDFAAIYLNFLLLLTGIVTLLGIVFAKPLVTMVAPGLLPETHRLAVLLLRLMFPIVILAAASYTFVGVLQSNGEYIIPSFISAVSNLLIIVYFLFFDGLFGIKGLAIAYSVAWCVQLITMIVPIIKVGYRHRLLFNFRSPSFITALKLTPPIIMGSWLSPVCLLLSMRFATYTETQGAIPSFEYAINLFTVITGITTYGVCNYIFPKLSLQANGSEGEFAKTGREGLLSALLMTVPIAAIVMALAPEGVSIVYLRGSFDADSARNVALILRTLVPGMLGFTLVEFLSRTFYAMKKPKFVVISVIAGIVADLIMLALLINAFSGDIEALGISYSVGILVSGITMLIFAATNVKGFVDVSYIFSLIKMLLAGAVSVGVMMIIKNAVGNNAYENGFIFNAFFAVGVAIAGLVVYLLLLAVMYRKFNPIKNIGKKV